MKLNKLLIAICSVATTLTFSTAAQALLLGQAGDIADGKPYKITKDEIASYFKDGTSGTVTFECNLMGDQVDAFLYPGKNFAGNIPGALQPGKNGPYTWKLYDRGDRNGNIKIQLVKGKEAIVQCIQLNEAN